MKKREGGRLHRGELRLGIVLTACLALAFGLRLVHIPVSAMTALLSFVVFALLISAYVLAGVPGLIKRIRADWRSQPARRWFLPLGLWILSLIYAALTAQMNLYVLVAGLIYCTVPFLLIERMRDREPRLQFSDVVLILFLWFPIEFGWVPDISIPPVQGVAGYYHLAALILLIALYLVIRNLPDVGFTYRLRASDGRTAVQNFLLFMPFALLIGFPTGFIALNPRPPGLGEMAIAFLAITFFTAIPEELLFRGVIHNLIERRLPASGRGRTAALLISSIIFGLAHGNNNDPPFLEIPLGPLGVWSAPWVYMILAFIAGLFYGWTFISTRRVTAAALVHALVDWTWGMFFHA